MMGRTIVAMPENGSRAARRRADATTDYLRRVAEEQDLDLLDFDNEIDCAILGDAAWKVTWDPTRGQVKGWQPRSSRACRRRSGRVSDPPLQTAYYVRGRGHHASRRDRPVRLV